MKLKHDSRIPILQNLAVRLVGSIEMRKLRNACTFPRIAQRNTLRAILTEAKDSVYGKEHDFEGAVRPRAE